MGRMSAEEYRARRREIIERYSHEIDEHESAGCYGDAENARKWMRIDLENLDRDYNEGRGARWPRS